MRLIPFTLVAFGVLAQCAPRAVSQASMTTVYIARHAEKLDPQDPESSLSTEGRARAAFLADRLKGENVTRIYATTKLRTQQTAAPLAQVLGIEPVVLDPYALDDLIARIRSGDQGRTVLVVGHSNSIPDIVRRLSGQGIEGIEENQYGRLFKVTLPADGAAALEEQRYGP